MAHQDQPEAGLVSPAVAMYRMISGFWLSHAIGVTATLRIADHLEERPKTADELAAATSTHAPSLYRLLRALAGEGVFAEDGEGRFRLTPLSETLRSSTPGSMLPLAVSQLGEEHFVAWANLLHCVKTGEVAFNRTFGVSIWEHYAQNPELMNRYNEAQGCMTATIFRAVPAAYDFSGFKKIVDVGGGYGNFISSILKANPRPKAVLFDRPPVAEEARRRIEAAGLSDRCEVVAGDMLEEVPRGGDAYLMKHLVQDWDDDRYVGILKNCRRAMGQGSKLIIIETVILRDDRALFCKLIDLNMLVMTGGYKRTEDEFRKFLEAAGFRLARIVPTESIATVMECVPMRPRGRRRPAKQS